MASCQRSEVYYMANFKSAILTTGTYAKVGEVEVEMIAPVDVSHEDRLSFQFYNLDNDADVVKVYGRIGVGSGTFFNAADYTQIGDDITVSGTTSVIKSIATTGLSWCGVTITPGDEEGLNTTHAMLRQA